MRKTIQLTTSIFLVLTLMTSCDLDSLQTKKRGTSNIEINDTYGMKIPNYMDESFDLNDEASLQYENTIKETYVVVIDESKQEFVDVFIELEEYDESISVVQNYRDIQLEFLTEGIEILHQSKPKSIKIKGLNAEIVEIDGAVEGVEVDISYFLTFVEGRENLYMIMAWTLKDMKEKHRADLEKIGKSFYLLKKEKK